MTVNQEGLYYYWIKAAFDRNKVIFDNCNNERGLVTKRLVCIVKEMMRRNNCESTHLFISPCMFEKIREVHISSQRLIFDGPLTFCGVRLYTLSEFSRGSIYWRFYFDFLGGTIPNSCSDFGIAMDMSMCIYDDMRFPDYLDSNRAVLFAC